MDEAKTLEEAIVQVLIGQSLATMAYGELHRLRTSDDWQLSHPMLGDSGRLY
jgi:hypothetical protein